MKTFTHGSRRQCHAHGPDGPERLGGQQGDVPRTTRCRGCHGPPARGLEGWGIDVIVCKPDVGDLGNTPVLPGGNTDDAPCPCLVAPGDQRRSAVARADPPQEEQQARGVKTYNPAAGPGEASFNRRKLRTPAK